MRTAAAVKTQQQQKGAKEKGDFQAFAFHNITRIEWLQ
jgi:hypothetical protein